MTTSTVKRNRIGARSVAAGLAMGVALVWSAQPLLAGDRTLTNASIRDAIEDEFLFDRVVPLNDIDVSVQDGIVTLTGRVNNLLSKDRAVNISEAVKGVRSVINRIEVKPATARTDSEVKSDVSAALLADPATDSYEISVSASSGRAMLSGTVESWQERQLCGNVAKGVKGVTDLENNISVNCKTDRPDYEIKPEIEQTLKWDVLVDDGLIDVAVEDGKATLTGVVGSAAEKRNARHDAWVAGVASVDVSGLDVKRWARDEDLRKNKYVSKPEEEIRKAVKDAMLYDPRVLSFNVTPEVSGSFVTLRGTVDNLRAKRAAEMNARHTVGVSVVNNRLKVRPVNPPSDDTIKAHIAEALLRDPYVERYEITANVHDGTAYLYGTVDSFFEKDRADDVTSRVNGVRDVKNRLVVDYDYYPPAYALYAYGWYPYEYHWYDFDPANTSKLDAEIKEEVKDQLWWSPFVDSEDITVSVHDGVVTLDGTVTNWTERVDAVKNAYDAGASRVKDDLVLSHSAD